MTNKIHDRNVHRVVLLPHTLSWQEKVLGKVLYSLEMNHLRSHFSHAPLHIPSSRGTRKGQEQCVLLHSISSTWSDRRKLSIWTQGLPYKGRVHLNCSFIVFCLHSTLAQAHPMCKCRCRGKNSVVWHCWCATQSRNSYI